MPIKIFKINYVVWTDRGDERNQYKNTQQNHLIEELKSIDFDVCLIERVSNHWADKFINLWQNEFETEICFLPTANIDVRLGYTGGSIIISKQKELLKNIGTLELPSSKPQTDAGNPVLIPKFTIGETEILVGQAPQNISRELSQNDIDKYLSVVVPLFPGAEDSDLIMIGTYNDRHHEYEIHTWQIKPEDAIMDDKFLIDYIKSNRCVGIVETLNFWDYKSDYKRLKTNFYFQETYEENMRDPVDVYTDCNYLKISSYPVDINPAEWKNKDYSVVRMFEIDGLL